MDSAKLEAAKLASEKKINPIKGIVEIPDPGGVRGVAETDTATIAHFRFLLEPLGVDVSTWSTSKGYQIATGKSYSFSDQFRVRMQEQDAFQNVWSSLDGGKRQKCKALQELSQRRLQGQYSTIFTKMNP